MLPRFLGISGPKKAGKTTTIETLVPLLVKKGLKVGNVKVAFKDVTIDVNKEHYDVIRLRKALPTKTLFKSRVETTIFYNEKITLRNALRKFSEGLDFILMEGFKEDFKGFPQIVLLNEEGQEEEHVDDYTAVISSIPKFAVKSSHEKYVVFEKLPGIVEKIAQPLFPELNCKHCGLESCDELIREVIAGRKAITDCYLLESEDSELTLKVNNDLVPCNQFVRTVFMNTILGLLKSLKLEEKELREIDVRISLEN